MKILNYLNYLKDAFWGQEFQKTILRNVEAADKLDRAVREMLGK